MRVDFPSTIFTPTDVRGMLYYSIWSIHISSPNTNKTEIAVAILDTRASRSSIAKL
jgi:hypothetical protein